MIGLKDKDVSEKLQLRSTLTLEQTIYTICTTDRTYSLVPNKHTIAGTLSLVIHSVIDVNVNMARMQDALPGVNAAKLITS